MCCAVMCCDVMWCVTLRCNVAQRGFNCCDVVWYDVMGCSVMCCDGDVICVDVFRCDMT